MKYLSLLILIILQVSCRQSPIQFERNPSSEHSKPFACGNQISEAESKISKIIDKVVAKVSDPNLGQLETIDFSIEDFDGVEKIFSKKEEIKSKLIKKGKQEALEYLRTNGFTIRVKLPLDLGLTNLLIEKISQENLSTKFQMEYLVSVKPDFETGAIVRKDQLNLSPEISAQTMIDQLKVSGSFSDSYQFSHIRHYPGFLIRSSKIQAKNNKQFLKPLKTVLKVKPIFFKKPCSDQPQELSFRISDKINIPYGFEDIDRLLLKNDTLIYQKNSVVSSELGTSVNMSQFTRLNIGTQKAKVLSQSLVIKKKANESGLFEVKAFANKSKSKSFSISAKTGLGDLKISGWSPLDKLLRKPLEFEFFRYTSFRSKDQKFLFSFFLAPDNPIFSNLSDISEQIKIAFNKVITETFYPSLRLKEKNIQLLLNFGKQKTTMGEVLSQSIEPLTSLENKIESYWKDNKLGSKAIYTSTCEKVNFRPLVNSVLGSVASQAHTSKLKLGIEVLNNYYERKSETQSFKTEIGNVQRNYLLTTFKAKKDTVRWKNYRRTKREGFVVTEVNSKKSQIDLKALGFQMIIEDSKFKQKDQLAYTETLRRIFPTGEIDGSESTELKEAVDTWSSYISPLFGSELVQLSFRILLNPEALELIRRKVFDEFRRSQNASSVLRYATKNPVHKYLTRCIYHEDPKYNNLSPCATGRDLKNLKYNINRLLENSKEKFENKVVDLCYLLNKTNHLSNTAPAIVSSFCKIGDQLLLIFTPPEQFRWVARTIAQSRPANVPDIDGSQTLNDYKKIQMDLLKDLVKNRNVITQHFFKKIAPAFFMYIFYHSHYQTDLNQFLIERNVKQYINFITNFKSTSKNYESPDFMFGSPLPETQKILKDIDFFNFQIDNIFENDHYCESTSQSPL